MTTQEAIVELQAIIDMTEEIQAYHQGNNAWYQAGYRRIEACRMAINALDIGTERPYMMACWSRSCTQGWGRRHE